jgi:hypothetical protein
MNSLEIAQEINFINKKLEYLILQDPENPAIYFLKGRLSLLPELQTKTRILEDRDNIPLLSLPKTESELKSELETVKSILSTKIADIETLSMIYNPKDWRGEY